MIASIVCLSWNKYDSFSKTVPANLKKTGLALGQYEFLLCDQGSTDKRLFHLYEELRPEYLRLNLHNEGIARALNQLILRARGRHVFFMPDDFILPDNWLKRLVEYADVVPRAGVVGFEGQDLIHPLEWVDCSDGQKRVIAYQKDPVVWEGSQIFGATLFTRKILDTIGYFCEEYHPYGLEDSDYCFRARHAGLINFYIPGFRAVHIGLEDNANKEEKERYYFGNLGLHRWRFANYHRIGVYCPPPMMKESLL